MTVHVERTGAIAVVTLDDPATKNAISIEMRRQLWTAFEEFALDDSVRAVVLTGANGNFCTGMNVGGMGQGGISVSLGRMHTLNRIARAIYHLKKPTIAAVPGLCVGVGWAYALACDAVIASDSARFAAIFRNIGLAPDGGMVWHLRQLVGIQRAKELIFSGRLVSADEAIELGLAIEKAQQAELMTRAIEMAQAFASGPTIASGLAKRQFDLAWNTSFDQYLELESIMQPVATRSSDHQEGLIALREKRRPSFSGE
jgi:2-(1,2-epoxy-1,2-dihydrophenyl)acetyl-CoA isomerase